MKAFRRYRHARHHGRSSRHRAAGHPGYSIPVPADSLFTFIGRAWVVGIPMPALLGILILLIGHIVLNHMRFGRYVTAIGATPARGAAALTQSGHHEGLYHQRNGRRAGGDDHYRTPRQRLLQPRAKALNCRSLLPLC